MKAALGAPSASSAALERMLDCVRLRLLHRLAPTAAADGEQAREIITEKLFGNAFAHMPLAVLWYRGGETLNSSRSGHYKAHLLREL